MTEGQKETLTDEQSVDVELAVVGVLKFAAELVKRGLEQQVVTTALLFAATTAMLSEDSPTSVSKQLQQMSREIEKNAPHH